ncbi:anaphase-promoting complex, cyclosome, subunit 4-domain-containing protein [Xylogone sp. PMI_703]|nr:anaphase-promoting complex, cyclosome, subunit 4-domain-containing protein [Xylogone sp. PMI_703]
MANSLSLELLGEKSLHQSVNSRLISYCPSMDLVAVATVDQQVLVYRLNGQRVWGVSQKSGKLKVEAICWKPNGNILAIAWSDGVVRLVGVESSKTVHQFATSNQESNITCIGWTSNLTKRSGNGIRRSQISWEEIFNHDTISSKKKDPLDLPRDLSLIDIEASLPKLSVLTAGGTADDVFCSRTSLDALFHPFDPKDSDAVDIMVLGTKQGSIHLSIYDSFVIGSFDSQNIVRNTTDSSTCLVLHSSHEEFSTHSLLLKSQDHKQTIYFVPMDLRFVSVSSKYLPLIASRSTAFQNLLRYVHQVQVLMVNEWKSTQDLPRRFLRNINETLGESSNRDIVQALYHSVATGHTFPPVKEWLVDELTDRGHKRWDKAVVSGLESLKKLVHESMLPALERCSVILSRLNGVVKFQGSDDSLGFTSHQVSQLVDVVACLHLVSSKILSQVIHELDLFASFSAWLHYEISRLGAESSNADEEAEEESGINHSKVLLYIQTCMMESPLSIYLSDIKPDDADNGELVFDQAYPLFDLLHQQLQRYEKGLSYTRTLPRLEFLCDHLSHYAISMFDQIAGHEKRNVLFGDIRAIGVSQSDGVMDMNMGKVDSSLCCSHIAFVPSRFHNQVQFVLVRLKIESGISSIVSTESAIIQLAEGNVKDIKFLNNRLVLILWETEGEMNLLSIPYSPDPHSGRVTDSRNGVIMEYTLYDFGTSTLEPAIFEQVDILARFSTSDIPNTTSFIADKMTVQELNNTRAEDVTRLVILGKNQQQYRIFKLGYKAEEFPSTEDTSML